MTLKLGIGGCIALIASIAWGQDKPAEVEAPRAAPAAEAVVDDDPFRYLEDLSSPRTQAYMREQAAQARAALDRIPGRSAMAERIRALSESGTTVSSLALAAGRVFYLKAAPRQASPVLCVREGLAGPERVLVDPQRFAHPGEGAAIDWFVPSHDGRHIAYGVARGGGDTVLRVFAVDRAADLPLEIDRARFNANLAWHPDGRSFYYARIPEGGSGAKRDANVRVYRHVLGREAARDEIVFAPGVGGARDVPEFAYPFLVVPQESRYAYAIVHDGARREVAVHVTEQKDLAAARPRWRKVAGFEDEVTAIEAWKDDLYLLSHRRAPRSRVLWTSAKNPDIARARVAVPEGDTVIQSMALARDALYLRTMLGGVDRLERLPLGLLGKPAEFVRTPFDTAIAQIVAHPRRPGALLRLQGWIEPPAVVEVDAKSGELRSTRLQAPPAVDLSGVDEVRLYAPGHDGVKIPVTLIYRKTTQLNGNNPTLIVGYGSHGVPLSPSFDAARLAWLERGGVLAIAHLRGGGEYGEAWHSAGRGGAKVTTVLDLVSVSQFLVAYGFTNPKRLAVMGTGEGGIAAGGAMVRRPELFAAVVARAPLMDMLRFETMASGPASVPEFGSAATPEGARMLRVVSAYHQVKEGTQYPAALLIAGMHDARADPWQAAKMAARVSAASASGKPVLLRIEPDSGPQHEQRIQELADIYSFLLWQFGDPQFTPPPAAVPADLVPAQTSVTPAQAGAQSPRAAESAPAPNTVQSPPAGSPAPPQPETK